MKVMDSDWCFYYLLFCHRPSVTRLVRFQPLAMPKLPVWEAKSPLGCGVVRRRVEA